MIWRVAARWPCQQLSHFAQSFLRDEQEHHVQAGGGQLQGLQAWVSAVFQAMVLLSREPCSEAHVALLQAELAPARSELIMNLTHGCAFPN
jgi:hypothetical protein